MSSTVSKLGTIHMRTGGMVLVRLPKLLLKRAGVEFKHKERVRVRLSCGGNVITITRMGGGRHRKHFD